MIKAEVSQNFEAVRSRIRRLPVLYSDVLTAVQKGDAERLTELFRDGILNRSLRLVRLTENTISEKQRKGYAAPETPLYRKGPDEENSYANMMQVTEEQSTGGVKRWIVKPRDEKHHESDLTLAELYQVHEYGAVINNAFGRGITVRIPPRPAMRYAYRKLMRERAKRETVKRVQLAIARYVRRNDRAALDKVKAKAGK